MMLHPFGKRIADDAIPSAQEITTTQNNDRITKEPRVVGGRSELGL
jgi:hypothetical protein